MAKLSLDLTQFKSAGVFTIEVDQSERITVTTQSLRLLPGFAKQGPYNAPVFIRSTRDRQRFYGDIDRKLERRGSFFQRSIDTCLLQAPVFAINLLKTDNTPDSSTADILDLTALSLDTSTAVQETNFTNLYTDLYVNFFERQKFWIPSPDYLQGVIRNKYGASNAESAPLFQMVNIGTKKLTFLVRKAVGIQGYSNYAKDWYGTPENIPFEWIRPYDKIEDYFVNVIAIEGDWTDYASLSTDPFYTDYFTSDGIIASSLNNFINLPNVNLIGSWYGTIIPDFRDQTGANQYIENIVNSSVSLTGVLINVNNEALDQLIWDASGGTSGQWEIGDGAATDAANYVIDLVGHNLIDYADPASGSASINKNFLSYDISILSAVMHTDASAWQLSLDGKSFELDASIDQTNITVGTLVKKSTTNGQIPGVTYVISKIFGTSTHDPSTSTYIYATAEPVNGYGNALDTELNIITQKPIDDPSISATYKMFKMSGLALKNRHLPGFNDAGAPNAEAGLTKIYGMLDDAGIKRGLTNPDMIQYRYVVDTMAYGLGANLGGKVYLSRLAKQRGKTTALISAPAFKQFAAAQDPYFTDTFIPGVDPVPIFSTEWIPQGGNPDMPRSFRFTLPDEDNGSRYCGVFGPYVTYTENGTTISIPPAADVANAYVRKFLGGDPFAIVANQDGILSNPALGGVEYKLDQTDRDYLEPFGINAIIEKPQTGQIMIYANVTSYQQVKSDFNYLHVRELLNTIELQIDEVLQQYVFQYNNPVTRLNIVNAITPLLESIKDSGALADYEIIMNGDNNNDDLISEGFGIVDVGVWINKGMEKIINRVTVNKLGTASSGGFSLN